MKSNNPDHPLHSLVKACGLAAALWVTVPSAPAATSTFGGTASGTYNWSAGTNWSAVPVSNLDTQLVYNSTLVASAAVVSNNDVGGNFLLNRLSITNTGTTTAGTLTLQGGTLEFVNSSSATAPKIVISLGGSVGPAVAINNNLLITNSLSVAATNSLTLGGAISILGNRTLNLASSSGTTTLGGAIDGQGGLTKSAPGLATLSGTNTYSGNTVVTEGALRISSAVAFSGNTNMQLNGGVLGADYTLVNSLGTGAGQIQFTGNSGFAAFGGAARTVNLGGAGATVTWGSGSFVGNGNTFILGSSLSTSSSDTVTFANGIDLGSSDRTIQVDNGTAATDATLSGALTGSGGLVKTGTGALNLTGTSNYSGKTMVRQGDISLNFSATTGTTATNLIGSGSALELGGGGMPVSLTVTSKSSSTNSQTFAGTTIKTGINTVTLARGNATGATTLDFGALSRDAGSVLVMAAGTNGTLASTVHFNATRTLSNGIIGGWATAGTDWATISGGEIVAYSGYTTLAGAAPTMASNAATNVRLSSGSTGDTGLASGVTDVNTLQYTDTASRIVTVGAGNTLRMGEFGGIWRTVATTTDVNSLTINGGTLTAGGANNTSGEITFNTGGAAADLVRANSGIIVNSVIADNGTGKVSLVKTGYHSLQLNGANTYTGDTYVVQGRIESTVANNLGGSGANVYAIGNTGGSGGQVLLSAAGDYSNNFYISGSGVQVKPSTVAYSHGAIAFNSTTASISGTITLLGPAKIASVPTPVGTGNLISGKITGNYDLYIGTQNQPNATVTLSNTGNDWGGNLYILGNSTTGGGSSVFLGNNEVIPNGVGKGDVYVSRNDAGTAATFSLNGYSETINGLNSGAIDEAVTRRIVRNNHASAASTLTVGDNNANGRFFGTMQNGSTGTLGLAKIGSGTQELAGTSTYTGTTTVGGGTLLITGTLTGTSGVTANTGGTFRYDNNGTALNRNVTVNGGKFSYNSSSNYAGTLTFTSGSIGGTNISNLNLTIGTGQTMAPGNSTGTMAAGTTTWANGGTFLFELNDATGTAGSTTAGWDLLNAASLDITAGVGQFTIQIASLDSLQAAGNALNFDGSSNYTWLFVDAGSAITGFNASNFVFGDLFTNSTPGTFSISQGTGLDTDKLYINYSAAIPEPSTYALLAAGLIGLWLVRSRVMKRPGV